jgi:hydroxymethylbilane synthase
VQIRIGTRGSDLALWQAHHVRERLEKECGADVEIRIIKTQGDRIQDVPLTPDLGKSFFTKEIEEALLSREVDLAVHSLKDLAVDAPPGLQLACVPVRERPLERLLVHPDGFDISGRWLPLRPGAIVGTSSPRRQRRLAELRPDLELRELRGNVPTRVGKLQRGDYDAILIAYAGVSRLELDLAPLHIRDLSPELFCGAAGQGALGLQIREEDSELLALLQQLEDPATERATRIERQLLKGLGGGCSLPLGALARCEAEGPVELRAYLFHPELPGASMSFEATDEDEAALLQRAIDTLLPALERPLEGRQLLVAGGPQTSVVSGQLQTTGANVELVRTFEFEDRQATREQMDFVARADHVMLASKQSALRLEAELTRHGLTLPEHATLLVPGLGSRSFVRTLFPSHEAIVGDPPRSEGMGRVAIARGAKRVACIGAVTGNDDGYELLRQQGIECQAIDLYAQVPSPGIQERWSELLDTQPAPAVLYLSPMAVTSAPPRRDAKGIRWVAIGPSTGRALEAAGLEHYEVAKQPDIAGVLAALR